jgi:hypothetical protein
MGLVKHSGDCTRKLLRVGILCLAIAPACFGNTIMLTMDPNFSDYHTYTYTDVDGAQHTTYPGPYPVTMSGGSFGSGVPVYVMCMDIHIDAYIGATYAGHLKHPTTEAEIEASYLQHKLALLGGYNADVQTIGGPIAMAIWRLMIPSSQNQTPFADDQAALVYIDEAKYAYQHALWTASEARNWGLWEPDPIGTTQRFGFVTGQFPVPEDYSPEPGTVLMMGGGLAAIVLLGTRRQARRGLERKSPTPAGQVTWP